MTIWNKYSRNNRGLDKCDPIVSKHHRENNWLPCRRSTWLIYVYRLIGPYDDDFKYKILWLMLRIEFLNTSCEIDFRYVPQNPINIGFDHGSVPLGNKPSLEPVLINT